MISTKMTYLVAGSVVGGAVGFLFLTDPGRKVMRTVREFIRAGVAGIHIEDQLYPKRAHYHGYQVHAIPLLDFVAKIKYACRQRDETDPDFVIIARSDTCREFGLDEAMLRVNAAAEAGADMGLVFPRSRSDETVPVLTTKRFSAMTAFV